MQENHIFYCYLYICHIYFELYTPFLMKFNFMMLFVSYTLLNLIIYFFVDAEHFLPQL